MCWSRRRASRYHSRCWSKVPSSDQLHVLILSLVLQIRTRIAPSNFSTQDMICNFLKHCHNKWVMHCWIQKYMFGWKNTAISTLNWNNYRSFDPPVLWTQEHAHERCGWSRSLVSDRSLLHSRRYTTKPPPFLPVIRISKVSLKDRKRSADLYSLLGVRAWLRW